MVDLTTDWEVGSEGLEGSVVQKRRGIEPSPQRKERNPSHQNFFTTGLL